MRHRVAYRKLGRVTAQPGIFALGTPEHCYLEFDLRSEASAGALMERLAGLTDPLSTVGGVNVVIGIRASAQPSEFPTSTGWPAGSSAGTTSLRRSRLYRDPCSTWP